MRYKPFMRKYSNLGVSVILVIIAILYGTRYISHQNQYDLIFGIFILLVSVRFFLEFLSAWKLASRDSKTKQR